MDIMKIFMRLVLVGTMIVALSSHGTADEIIVNSQGDARLINEPSGNRNDNNGGNTISGALIGLNTGGVDNLIVHEFHDLSAVAGTVVTGATVLVNVQTGFSNGNHGTTDDLINLSAIALPNIGWDSGSSAITGSDTPATDGSVSFNNRSEFNSASSIAWQDGSGTDVADITGSFTLVDSIAGYNQGAAPATLVFTVDAATAQDWVDNGLGGLALWTTDDGDSRSRFNFSSVVNNNGATRIVFNAVPEPGSGIVCGMTLMMLGLIRRRK